ncbi:MAG: ABC transporter permease [Vicinamibacterales bacterium]
MAPLAWRNLFHDRVRLGVTLTGIVFSVVLAAIQLGLFLGFTTATADVIDHSGADLWIVSAGATHLEGVTAFSEQQAYRALGTPGVARVEKRVVQFSQWKRADGAEEGVLLAGFEPAGVLGRPWNVVAGDVRDLEHADTVFIDELYASKLGVTHLGQVAEIRGYRARVVGFTRGIRTFTTAPPVFTSFKNAQNYFGLREDQVLALLVGVTPGADVEAVRGALQARLRDVDVHTTAEWSQRQQRYWMFGTGAGITVLIAAALGLIVGVVVVAQTIYAATVDHIREFGTLKAMGATNGFIYGVILVQALTSGVIGFAAGIGIALAVAAGSQQGTTAILAPPWLVALLFVLTLGMCALASIVSINKVTRLDPAMVFKG